METVAFFGFAAMCGLLLALAIRRPQRIYEYPHFMAVGFAVFALPQAYTLLCNPALLPEQSLSLLLLMCCLCLGMCWLGYQLPVRSDWINSFCFVLDEDRLFHSGVAFVAIGFFFDYMIADLPEEMKGAAWSGNATKYLFFAILIYPGFTICLFSLLKNPNLATLVATLLAAVIPLKAAIFYGRREPTVAFLVSIGLALYFRRGFAPPRSAVAFLLFAATLVLPGITEYRRAGGGSEWDKVRNIDFLDHFREAHEKGHAPELRLAAEVIHSTQQTEAYRYGVDYWNQLVFRYIPAQFVGRELKESLSIGSVATGASPGKGISSRLIPLGTTTTGLGDAFQQFGFLGCLFFALVAYLYKHLWIAAENSNNVAAQIFYAQNITVALRAMTHGTIDFLPGLIFNAIFLGAVVWYAQQGTPSRYRVSEQVARPTRPGRGYR